MNIDDSGDYKCVVKNDLGLVFIEGEFVVIKFIVVFEFNKKLESL